MRPGHLVWVSRGAIRSVRRGSFFGWRGSASPRVWWFRWSLPAAVLGGCGSLLLSPCICGKPMRGGLRVGLSRSLASGTRRALACGGSSAGVFFAQALWAPPSLACVCFLRLPSPRVVAERTFLRSASHGHRVWRWLGCPFGGTSGLLRLGARRESVKGGGMWGYGRFPRLPPLPLGAVFCALQQTPRLTAVGTR